MTDIRKNLIILTFVLSGVLASLLALNFQEIEKGQGLEILNARPEISRSFPVKISRGTVNFFNLKGGSGKVVFYEEIDSVIYEIGFDARNKKELARTPDVLKIVFSPNGYEIVATELEKGIIKNYYFDLNDDKRAALPKEIENAVFSPDGRKIAYYLYNRLTGEGNISVTKPDGGDAATIFRTRIKNLGLLWPETNLIILYSAENEGNQPLAFSMTPDGKEFQRMSGEELNSRLKGGLEEINVLQELGIETINSRLSPLKDHLIFINAKDGKLYSLKI